MPTASCSWKRAASSKAAHMTNCLGSAAATRRFTICRYVRATTRSAPEGGYMAEELETERSDVRADGRRPPRAVVGSHRIEQKIFGKVFDKNIVRRIWAFVRP